MSRIQEHLIFSIQIFLNICVQQQHHVVNIRTFKKINILEYALGRSHKKEYSLYAFIIVDNCEQLICCEKLDFGHLSLDCTNILQTQNKHTHS